MVAALWQGVDVLNARVRAGWDRFMRPLGRAVANSGISPDAITYFSVVLAGVAAYYIVEGHLLIAGIISTAAGVADLFDGAVAKAKGVTSKFGAVLDSTTDRLTDALVFLPIVWLYAVRPDLPSHDEPWVAITAMVALVASFMVSYVKARAEGLGFDCNVGIAERAERLILINAALILDFVPVAMVILAAAAIVTFFQRILYVRKQARAT